MKNTTKLSYIILAVVGFSLFISNCFAVEITARYDDGAPGFEQPGVPEVSKKQRNEKSRNERYYNQLATMPT